jgi:DNA-binding XRE family transcriptional regulator
VLTTGAGPLHELTNRRIDESEVGSEMAAPEFTDRLARASGSGAGTEDINAIVGRNVRRLRLAAGLSQEAFAHACGLHRTYIGAVERGERKITLSTLVRIAAALAVTPVELLLEPAGSPQ